MPCPYAERKGPAVYCRLIGKKVNPLAFPCLTDKYEKCRYYRRHAAEAKREEKPAAPATMMAGVTFEANIASTCCRPSGTACASGGM